MSITGGDRPTLALAIIAGLALLVGISLLLGVAGDQVKHAMDARCGVTETCRGLLFPSIIGAVLALAGMGGVAVTYRRLRR